VGPFITSLDIYGDPVVTPVPPLPTGRHPLFLDADSGVLTQPFSDKLTGEKLRMRVDVPTNSYWNYSYAFDATSVAQADSALHYDDSSKLVKFLRVFRSYTVSPSDLVLVKEDVF
jgi:hypothetical protein